MNLQTPACKAHAQQQIYGSFPKSDTCGEEEMPGTLLHAQVYLYLIKDKAPNFGGNGIQNLSA